MPNIAVILYLLILLFFTEMYGGDGRIFPSHSSPLAFRNSKGQPLHEMPKEFNPYSDNGGTIMGIAGKDFVLIASDTRLSESYFIRSRNVSRVFEIGDGVLLTASGCWADIVSLVNHMKHKARVFNWEHKQPLQVEEFASLLSSTLYERRSFPYFSFCLLGGIDENGAGALYHYDAVGSKERVRATCAGKGEQMMQTFLDEVTDMEKDDGLWTLSYDATEFTTTTGATSTLSKQDAISLAIKAFKAAAEREISIGDGVQIVVLSKVPNQIHRYSIESQIVPLPSH